jgi:inosine-uridine nucleoside N-ribohydrolase
MGSTERPSHNPWFDPSILPSVKNRRFHSALSAVLLAVAVASLAHGQAPPTSAGQQLVIIDTDIGDDIDDAFAVALALRSPELHILGITTAFGDTELRARLLDRYLGAVGRADIPVAAGVATPQNNVFTQAAYAHHVPELKRPDAVAFLLDQIRAHPGQITLIAIGPLFNVQAAIERDPVTFRQLRRVVIMGGSIYRGYGEYKNGSPRPPEPEWNIKCDPAGARALLSAGVPVFVMPLDSTQIPLETPAQGAIFSHGSPLTDQLTLLYHLWTGASEWRTPTLFDPVAVTYAIRPDLCPTTPMRLEVDDKGFTTLVQGAPNAQVCLKSNESGFMTLLLDRITSDAPR